MQPTPELISLAGTIAAKYGLTQAFVCAICEQESGWNPKAIRMEPGFFRREASDYFRKFPDAPWVLDQKAYSSYGLMQTMFPVAWELGYRDEPEGLWEPTPGIEYGVREYLVKMEAVRKHRPDLTTPEQQTHRALTLYNGGFRPAYADEVLARIPKYQR